MEETDKAAPLENFCLGLRKEPTYPCACAGEDEVQTEEALRVFADLYLGTRREGLAPSLCWE